MKNKICNICKLKINSKEDYCKLINYIKGTESSSGFYHLSCFKDKLLNNHKLNQLQSKAMDFMDKAMESLS